MEETIENVEVPSSNVSKQNDDGLDMKTLFVRSIPQDVTDEQLADFFSNFAPIKHAVVVKDTNKRSRGFGFVSFAVEDDTKEALAKARKTKFNGHILRVDIAKEEIVQRKHQKWLKRAHLSHLRK